LLVLALTSEACKVSVEDWFGNVGKTTARHRGRTITEFFVFIRESENDFCTYGQRSGKTCFYRAGTSLFRSRKFKAVYGFIKDSGMIMWSVGAQSHLAHPCGMTKGVTCTVQANNLVGRAGRTWRTTDVTLATVEKNEVEKEGEKFCFVGNITGRVCATYDEETRRFTSDKKSWITGTLHPNGQILWSHGFGTYFKGDLCRDYSNSEVGNENERRKIEIIKEENVTDIS